MVCSLGAFALMVGCDNLVDYGSNFVFVRHVLSMDDTFAGNMLLWRSIRTAWCWHAAYLLIIGAELLTGLLFAAGGVAMARHLRAPADAFATSKRLVHWGTLCGFLLWFLGFMVIGGEWFLMWQSPHWNGQEAAFRFLITMVAVCIYVQMPD